MADVIFFPIPPWSDRESPWKNSNRALGRLIAHHRNDLKAARSLAEAIRSQLMSLFGLMDDLCRNCCPWCPDPCCILNKVWFDFRDLLFFHLLELPIPPAQLNCGDRQACRYLSHHGCRIPRIIRPWACTRYICGTQTRHLARLNTAPGSRLHQTIETIGRLRIDLENSVHQVCVTNRRENAARQS